MERLLNIVLASFALMLLGSAANAGQRPDPNCSDDRGVDRCAEDQHRRVLALFGLQPIESHHKAGDVVRRVFYVDGYGRDLVAISFVRPPGDDPVLQVHFPRRQGGEARPPMEAAVSQALWGEISASSRHFDRKLAPLPQPGSPEVDICMHSWV